MLNHQFVLPTESAESKRHWKGLKMAIRFEALNGAEKRSAAHICPRCETEQARGQLHHCTATEAWKGAKAAMHAENPLPPPRRSRLVNSRAEPVNIDRNAD